MRTSILVWSAVGGAVVGLIVAALVVGAGVLLHLALPAAPARFLARTAPVSIPVVVALLALAGAVLGYLEGRLKL